VVDNNTCEHTACIIACPTDAKKILAANPKREKVMSDRVSN